jgi:hypothetical protein
MWEEEKMRENRFQSLLVLNMEFLPGKFSGRHFRTTCSPEDISSLYFINNMVAGIFPNKNINNMATPYLIFSRSFVYPVTDPSPTLPNMSNKGYYTGLLTAVKLQGPISIQGPCFTDHTLQINLTLNLQMLRMAMQRFF